MYAHFIDHSIDVYVGPFNTQAELDAHVAFVAENDSGSYVETVGWLPAEAVVFTQQEDVDQLLSA